MTLDSGLNSTVKYSPFENLFNRYDSTIIMSQSLLERKKKLIGKRSDRNQEFWIGVVFFLIGLIFSPTLIGIPAIFIGIILILWGWEAKSKIDQELSDIDFELDKKSGKSESIEDPLKILKIRYSKGEITKKQFETMKKNLA